MKVISGVGTELHKFDYTNWVKLANVTNISWDGISRELLEVTSIKSVEDWKEYTTGYMDGGTVQLTLNFTRDSYDSVAADMFNAESMHYKIIIPDENGTTFDFLGFITETPIDISTDKQITMTVTLKITSKVYLSNTDLNKPIITLNRKEENPQYVAKNDPNGYLVLGATAYDAVDGDITADINTTDTINMAVVGEYTVTHNVVDLSGNHAVPVTRTVIVVESIPTVVTGDASSIGVISASFNIVINGDSSITDLITRRGWIFDEVETNVTGSNPSAKDGPMDLIADMGFGLSITFGFWRFTGATTYYYRAYATNPYGTAYGEVKSFTTVTPTQELPLVTTLTLTDIRSYLAEFKGELTNKGTSNVFAYGFSFGLASNDYYAAFSRNTTDLSLGDFTNVNAGLSPNTTYYYKAWAKNSSGIGYGEEMSFTTDEVPANPEVQSELGTNYYLTSEGMRLIARLIERGIDSPVELGVLVDTVESKLTTVLASKKSSKNTTTNNDVHYPDITGLTPNTLYYFRAYAQGTQGPVYGATLTFTTLI